MDNQKIIKFTLIAFTFFISPYLLLSQQTDGIDQDLIDSTDNLPSSQNDSTDNVQIQELIETTNEDNEENLEQDIIESPDIISKDDTVNDQQSSKIKNNNLDVIFKINFNSIKLYHNIATQYTGIEDFQEIDSFGYTSYKLGLVKDFNIPVIRSIGIGIEYFDIYQELDSLFFLSNNQTQPDEISYILFEYSVTMIAFDFYFINSFYRGNESFKLYVGFGLGSIDGHISGETSSQYSLNPDEAFESNISGLYGNRKIGFVFLGDYFGWDFSIIFHNRGNVSAKNDFFNTKNQGDEDLKFNFSGISYSFGLAFRI